MIHNKVAHEKLLGELDTIKTTEKHKAFLSLVRNGDYNQALWTGCHDFDDEIQTKLLEILLKHKKSLSLDVDVRINGLRPVDVVVKRQQFNGYFLLERMGANVSDSKWAKLISDVKTKISSLENAAYRIECEQIVSLFTALPEKVSFQSVKDNELQDNSRILCIIKILSHIITYHKDLNDMSFLTECQLTSFEKQCLYSFRVAHIRENITRIATIIHNLSTSFRLEYQPFLEPLSWYTLEELGGIMQSHKPVAVYLPLDNCTINDPIHFLKEYLEHDHLIDETVPDIIDELTILKDFFKQVYIRHVRNQDAVISPVILPVIKTAIKYSLEKESLLTLLNLANYSERTVVDLPLHSRDILITARTQSRDESNYQSRANVETKLGQHALLRRFQRIGELLVENKSQFSEFDPSIDFLALVTLRNGICHQDQKSNKFIIDSLLEEPEKLERMAKTELKSLFQRLQKFIKSRESVYGIYQGDLKGHWKNVLDVEQKRFHLSQEKMKEVIEVVVARRVTIEEENEFLEIVNKIVKDNLVSIPDLTQRITECVALLDGTGPTFDKKTLGLLLAPFAVLRKGEHGELYKRLSVILTGAVNQKTSLEERESRREKSNEEAKHRKLVKAKRLTGLETIQEIAEKMEVLSVDAHPLTGLKRVNAAIDALTNIRDFLIETGYIVPNMNFHTMEQWDYYHLTQETLGLCERLVINYQLNDALEYNAGQLLQHLDKIRTYQSANNCEFLNKNYPSLRALRNYIEHGDPLIPSALVCLNTKSPEIYEHQKIIAPQFIELIFKLLPELYTIKKALEDLQTVTEDDSLNTESFTKPAKNNVSPLATQSMFSGSQRSKGKTKESKQTDIPLMALQS